MAILEVIRRYTQRKTYVQPEELRKLAQSGQYKKVAELHQSGQVQTSKIFDVLGFCYFQLTNYEVAMPFLRGAIKLSPADYYSNLFLALCLKNTGNKPEALTQLLSCLKLNPQHAGDVLGHLLPLVADLPDSVEKQKLFAQIEKVTKGPASPHFAKILFFQNKDLNPSRFYSAKELSDQGMIRYTSLGPPEKLRFIDMKEGSEKFVDTNSPYIAEISDAQIISGSSLVLVGKDRVLSDNLANKEYGQFVDMQYDPWVIARRKDALLLKPIEAKTEIPEGIMLCGLASGAYGHWFAEFLPKLRHFEKHPRFSEIPIIVDEVMPASHFTFLSALVKNPIYRLPKGEALRVKNLLVAPTDTFFPTELVVGHGVPPEHQPGLTTSALGFIGERIRETFGQTQSTGSRIFLSRRNSQWRRLLEEEEIRNSLRDLNFETIYIEDYPFEKQVRIFQNAEFIIGPNGSAMTNSIFAPPEVKFLILGQKNTSNLGGWFGSLRALGYDPQYLAGESVGDKGQKHLDYSIPVSVVRNKVLEMLGTTPSASLQSHAH